MLPYGVLDSLINLHEICKMMKAVAIDDQIL